MLLGSVWFSAWSFALFFAAVQVKMLLEFYRMMRAGGYAPAKWIGVGAGLLIFAGLHSLAGIGHYLGLPQSGNYTILPPISVSANFFDKEYFIFYVLPKTYVLFYAAVLIVPVGLVLREIRRWPKGGQPFVNIAITYGGLFYVSLSMSLLNSIAFSNNGYDYRRIFGLLFLVWASDIGAYAAGRTFGKRKLAPSISPGKTWEGWAGGFLLTLAVGWALKFMLPDVPLAHLLVAAGVVAVFGPIGDLAESMLKRSVGVKDSGTFMPGHGGLLDRFDAFLLVLPVLALLQLLAN